MFDELTVALLAFFQGGVHVNTIGERRKIICQAGSKRQKVFVGVYAGGCARTRAPETIVDNHWNADNTLDAELSGQKFAKLGFERALVSTTASFSQARHATDRSRGVSRSPSEKFGTAVTPFVTMTPRCSSYSSMAPTGKPVARQISSMMAWYASSYDSAPSMISEIRWSAKSSWLRDATSRSAFTRSVMSIRSRSYQQSCPPPVSR